MSDLGLVAQGEYPSRRSAYQARPREYVWVLADSLNVTQAAHSMGVLKRTRPVPCACAGRGRIRSAWRGSGVENSHEAGVGAPAGGRGCPIVGTNAVLRALLGRLSRHWSYPRATICPNKVVPPFVDEWEER